MTGLQHFNKEQKEIDSPMFNHHSLIPWGSFRCRQEEKWVSFRGWDHFGGCTVELHLLVRKISRVVHIERINFVSKVSLTFLTLAISTMG